MDPVSLTVAAIGLGMDLFGIGSSYEASGAEQDAINAANYDYAQEYQASVVASGYAKTGVQLEQQQSLYDYQRALRMNDAQAAMMMGSANSNVTLAGAGMSSAAIGGSQQLQGQRLSANAQATQNNQLTQGRFQAQYGELDAQNQMAYWQSQANQAMRQYTSAQGQANMGNNMVQFGNTLVNQAPNASNLANYAGQQFFGGGAGSSMNWMPVVMTS